MAKRKTSTSGREPDERSANAVDRHVGERVRSTRLERQMSQERLAEILGVTFQQVQKYEKGTNRIAASRLYDISLAFDVSVNYFFKGLPTAKKIGDDDLDQEKRARTAREITALATQIVQLSDKLSD